MDSIKCNKSIVIGGESKFIAQISQNEEVCIETLNAFGDSFTNLSELEHLMSMKNPPHHHPLTGPIEIKGAKPGDFLKVHIENIEILEMAQMLSKSAGIAPLENNENFDFSSRFPIIVHFNDKNGSLQYFKNQINFVAKPCIGIIATKPSDCIIKTGHIGCTGGNFDNPIIS